MKYKRYIEGYKSPKGPLRWMDESEKHKVWPLTLFLEIGIRHSRALSWMTQNYLTIFLERLICTHNLTIDKLANRQTTSRNGRHRTFQRGTSLQQRNRMDRARALVLFYFWPPAFPFYLASLFYVWPSLAFASFFLVGSCCCFSIVFRKVNKKRKKKWKLTISDCSKARFAVRQVVLPKLVGHFWPGIWCCFF